MKFTWNPDLYSDKHDFVYKFGDELVALLNPAANERILDLGCGTGELTSSISKSCAEIVGVDNSAEMIRSARSTYEEISFVHGDARDVRLDTVFDAVFSSSVLHWVTEPDRAITTINRHLRMGGRFVAEFGGKGCVNGIISTLTDILDSHGKDYPPVSESLYYPSISEYSHLLETHGFEVRLAMLFDRPTELKGELDGLRNFIEMFFVWLFDNVSARDRATCITEAEERLRDTLLHGSTWMADYRRIRILAIKVRDCCAV